jgi:hypothetical protein
MLGLVAREIGLARHPALPIGRPLGLFHVLGKLLKIGLVSKAATAATAHLPFGHEVSHQADPVPDGLTLGWRYHMDARALAQLPEHRFTVGEIAAETGGVTSHLEFAEPLPPSLDELGVGGGLCTPQAKISVLNEKVDDLNGTPVLRRVLSPNVGGGTEARWLAPQLKAVPGQ